MKNAILLSGRNKSTRLPDKLFLPLLRSTTLEMLIERLKQSKKADGIVMATSDHPDDAVFGDICARNGIEVFYGHPDDKLVRYRDACEALNVMNAVIVDADDLLSDFEAIDRIFSQLEKSGDYVIVDNLPLGATGFGVTLKSLTKVCELKKMDETEVWGQLFADNPVFECHFLESPKSTRRPHYRLTLDYMADLELFRAIYTALYPVSPTFTMREVCKYLDENPDLSKLNAGAQAKYEENLRQQLKKQDAQM